MEQTLRVKRYDPENPDAAGYQEYTIEVDDTFTVLDALLKIRDEIDGTLSMRCSCRASICGSCAMRVNGQAKLVCKTRVSSVSPDGEPITIDPPGNMPVIKDLVVDFKPFWDKIRAVDPFLRPEGEEPEAEHIVSDDSMVHLVGVMNCIMCGACVSDCTVLEVDPNFLGPAALAKAYRFVKDPRDSHAKDRLAKLNEDSGVWDCTRCMECITACPKGVAPMDRIMALREQAISVGLTNSNGARHAEVFGELVGESGRLDELKLPVKTVGITNVPALLSFLPVGIRALTHGKMPSPIHKSIEGVDGFRRLYKKAEKEGEE